MAKQFISPPEVGPTMGMYQKAVRAGNTIYISGQVAWDAEGNTVGRGDVEAQTARLFENMETVLSAAGAGFGDIVSSTSYMTSVLYRPTIAAARAERGLTSSPHTLLVMSSLARPDLLVEVAGVAVVDTEREVIQPVDVHDVSDRYAHAIRAGDTVYLSGQVALDPDGKLVGPGDIEAQATQVFENMRRVMAAAGGTLDDIVKITAYMTNVLYREGYGKARQAAGMAETPSTLIVVPSLALPEFLIEIEAVAVLGGAKEVIRPTTIHDQTGRYAPAIRAGNTIYMAGSVPLNPDSSLAGPGDVEAQANRIYENIRLTLEAAGASLDDVVRTTTYLTNMAYRQTNNDVRKQFGLTNTANSTVAVASLARPDYLLEVEALAVVES